MTNKIFRSICLVAVCVFLASLILILGVVYSYYSRLQEDQLQTQTQLIAQGASHEGLSYFSNLTVEDCTITWIDTDGTILYNNRTKPGEAENHLERVEVIDALKTGYGESSRYSATLLERSLYSAQRLPDGTVLHVATTQHSILTLVLGFAQPICIVITVALALSLYLAFRLSRKIVQPLNRLNLDAPMDTPCYEELTPLLRRIDAQQLQLRSQAVALSRKQNEFDAVTRNMNEGLVLLNHNCLVFDVTAKRKAEQLRREFTANVSHELKTPLHAISGYAELMSHGIARPEDTLQFSDKIYTEAQRMIRLVEDIIHLSRLDEGAGINHTENVDLRAKVQEILTSLSVEAQQAQVTLKAEGGPLTVKTVPHLLSGIIRNLCDNAIKYNRPGGRVTVKIGVENAQAYVCVSDTGIGIPKEHQDRIFERFYRVDKSHSKSVGGTGLGLSIVKHAAQAMNATLELESEPDVGTSITLRLPH